MLTIHPQFTPVLSLNPNPNNRMILGTLRPKYLHSQIPSSSIVDPQNAKTEFEFKIKEEEEEERERSISLPPNMLIAIQYLVGGIVASLLGLLLVSRKYAKKVGSLSESRVLGAANGGPDVVIVGAGVAGAALAYALGKDGRQVHVIERDLSEPDRIVGELLQPGGYLKLIDLDCVEGIDAQHVFGYALFKDGKHTKLSYPLEKYDPNVAGRSFHNGRFIQRMREKAASLPNVKLEEGTVTTLLEENGTVKGVSYKTKAVTDVQLLYPNHGHVILADPSPILLYQISSTEVRFLVDVPGQKLPSIANGEMAKYLKSRVAPQIPVQMHDAFVSAIDSGSIRTMPNRSMPASPLPTPGALLLGDAFNMRHPLTGGGMTVALSDIVLLRDLLRPLHDLHDGGALCKYLESFYIMRKPVASTINTLAGALYRVFSASTDQAMNEMREACFDYLSLGGGFSKGPISLLSGLNPCPLSLVAHFFAVAIFGVGRLLFPFPSPKRLWIGTRLISVASGVIFPLIEAEGVWQMFFPATLAAYYRAPPSSTRSMKFLSKCE